MSLSTLKPASFRVPPVTGGSASHSKVSKMEMMKRAALPSLQAMRKEGKPQMQEAFKATSRREIMHLGAASLGFLSVLSAEAAEARTRNADIRKKIFEKLEELREKAGFSKPEAEDQEKKQKDEAKEKESKPKAEAEEKKSKPNTESEEKKSKATTESEEKKSKPTAEAEEKKSKPNTEAEEKNKKPINGSEEEKPTPQQSIAPPLDGSLIPPLPSLLNGKTVETNLS